MISSFDIKLKRASKIKWRFARSWGRNEVFRYLIQHLSEELIPCNRKGVMSKGFSIRGLSNKNWRESCVYRLLYEKYMILETHITQIWDLPSNEKNIMCFMHYILCIFVFSKLPFMSPNQQPSPVSKSPEVVHLITFKWASRNTTFPILKLDDNSIH